MYSNSLKAHVTRTGAGAPLVLFHGWGFDSQVWNPILPMLAGYYDVYCVDLPGFGQSPFMDWASFKQSVLNQLPEKFAVMGWSLGGLVATYFAIEASSRVTHFINIASSPYFVGDSQWPGIPKENLKTFYQRLKHDPQRLLSEFIALQLRGKTNLSSASPTLEGLKAGLDCLLFWDFRMDLNRLLIPGLYLFGRLDAIIPQKTMQVMQLHYPKFSYVMFSKAAHALFISHPDLCVASIREFYV